MNEELSGMKCNRQIDLVSFLYGEMTDRDKASFQSHMRECGECSSQYAAFSNVRKSVGTWRDESLLGSLGVLATAPAVRPIPAKPSAFAALREFFNLSPLWLKGAVAVASLLFCLLAALAIVRFRDTPTAPLANNQVVPEQQQITTPAETPREEVATIEESKRSIETPSERPVTPRRIRTERAAKSEVARRPLSKSERQELAVDLRLVESGNDSDLELISDRINNE